MLIQTNFKVITISLGNECQRDRQVRENSGQSALHAIICMKKEIHTHIYLYMDSVSEDTWAIVGKKIEAILLYFMFCTITI